MSLPEGFVYLHDYDSSIKFDIRYATHNNFVGRPLAGYAANVCIVSLVLAKVLSQLQVHLKAENVELMIYETYRPQQASEDIVRWCQDLLDQKNKVKYYPDVDKRNFHRQQYVMHRSAHTRGSTVDLTLLDRETGEVLDMGTRFDFFGLLSHPDNNDIAALAYENRQYLRNLMQQYGFTGIDTEWWHFTLDNEPFLDTYFDFLVK
jgi:D-alanyl-D-alanine dipeptidase